MDKVCKICGREILFCGGFEGDMWAPGVVESCPKHEPKPMIYITGGPMDGMTGASWVCTHPSCRNALEGDSGLWNCGGHYSEEKIKKIQSKFK